MKEYKVVQRELKFELEDEVNRLMREGWTPIGGVQVAVVQKTFEWDIKFYQAMLK
jgi:hypothetical protein